MTHREKAIEYFCKGYNCAQSVFAAFCDVTGFTEEEALRISSSFGGGMGRMREVCGACSAMFMVAGVVKGYTDISTDEPKKEHYELVQAMAEEFKKEHGTMICRELLASLKPDSAPTPSARTEEYYRERPCARFVATAADIVDKIVL
jgi:C_GCAxxG_C_C family probable redox protein